MEIRIYFEGKSTLRAGFEALFSELNTAAREAESRIQFVSAKNGLSDYRKAERTHPQSWNILLKDSEQSMPERPVDLCAKHGIHPQLVDHVFWMVELMEAWFLADPEALADYYGERFNRDTIGNPTDVEQVAKTEVLRQLKHATRNTTKGEYHKIKHAPYLLEKLNSHLVRDRARHFRQLSESVIAKLNQA